MKKVLVATLVALSFGSQAANFVQVEQEHVTGRKGADNSEVSYVRFGKDIGDYGLGVQSRTARFGAGGTASNAAIQPGGGGGGDSYNTAGTGGKGIVIIRYNGSSEVKATGGTITQASGYVIHTFTGDGTFRSNAINYQIN